MVGMIQFTGDCYNEIVPEKTGLQKMKWSVSSYDEM